MVALRIEFNSTLERSLYTCCIMASQKRVVLRNKITALVDNLRNERLLYLLPNKVVQGTSNFVCYTVRGLLFRDSILC